MPATFRWRDITVENVAVRFKGNSSSSPRQTHKRSYVVKFDKADKERRFFGLRQVSFDNAIQFGSLFSEPIITEILRDHGIPTHRCNYAKLYVNEEYRGVYVNVERIDESFLANHLPDASGALFKLINQTEPKEFAKTLEAKMEVDDFLRVTAVMLFSGAFDQLTGWNPHNYFLYHDAKRDRWRYLPWDLDVGFCETAFEKIRVHDDWHAAWPVPATGAPNPLLERIIADPVLLERYRKEARKILDRSFEPQRLCQVIDAKYELIKEALKTDPFPHRRVTVPGDRSYDQIVDSMKAFVRKRSSSAVEQLENPLERPKVRRPPGLPPQLAAKIQRIQNRAEEMQRSGQDVSPIAKVMQRLGPAVQAGTMEEAEKVVAEALKLLGEQDE